LARAPRCACARLRVPPPAAVRQATRRRSEPAWSLPRSSATWNATSRPCVAFRRGSQCVW